MTEAPGRKNDAHLSSVPGDEGRAAKIGEVFALAELRYGVVARPARNRFKYGRHFGHTLYPDVDTLELSSPNQAHRLVELNVHPQCEHTL